MMDNIIIDRVQIIGTNRVVWKAWKFWETGGISYSTITHFSGDTYGRMGTECPDDGYPSTMSPAERWNAFAKFKAEHARAAHQAIMRGMPKTKAKRMTFDDNGTIEMEI